MNVTIIGIMVAATHIGPMDQGTDRTLLTPGVYAVSRSGITAGVYRNSLKRTSALVGYTQQLEGRWAISYGLVSGYPPGEGRPTDPSRIGPYVAVSYAFGGGKGVRILTMPHATIPLSAGFEVRQ